MALAEKFVLNIPIQLISEANISEHWTKRRIRHKRHNRIIQSYLLTIQPGLISLPQNITYMIELTRIAPRKLDGDNLQMAFKSIRDCVAAFIIPGKAPGRSDDDNRLQWSYNQLKGHPKQHSIQISIDVTQKV